MNPVPRLTNARAGLMRRGRVLARALVPRRSVRVVAAQLGVSVSLVRKIEALALGRIRAALARERIEDGLYL